MSLDPVNRSLVRLILYYAVLVVGTLVLERNVPAVREAVTLEVPVGTTARQLRKALQAGAENGGEESGTTGEHARPAVMTALGMAGALALVVPVAWVYMLTKRRHGYDASVVQTVILLPLAIAGIVAVVRNSLALAFSLAGLAAAVRFRNTLEDTKDAVYIFLAMAVGLAAGVQALELGFVVSLSFNVAVLALWALNVGDLYAGEERPTFTREFRVADPERQDGVLVVQADTAAQESVETVLHEHARSWKLVARTPPDGGRTQLTYLVRLKKKTAPATLVAAVSHRAAPRVATAEFQPLSS
ncbi:MAG TPA: DUF4956 domain-containing protein [Gemmatimonadales bacterium]|jgi:hypothetical protein|nr:DUF4956 domain-containing protein [Gemmatimonadales bacterium]